MIDRCAFGSIVIDGQQYNSDLIIYPDGQIVDNWWRSSGHRLTLNDITDLVNAQPEYIVAGTGVSGQMRPEPSLKDALAGKGIVLLAEPNQKAMLLYNEKCSGGQRVGACFHLTC